MILYFLRHASAGEHVANPKKDEKRALDKEGIEQCGYVGRGLAALNAQVDAIVSSPLKRCTQTGSLVGNELGYEGKLQIDAALRLPLNIAGQPCFQAWTRLQQVLDLGPRVDYRFRPFTAGFSCW